MILINIIPRDAVPMRWSPDISVDSGDTSCRVKYVDTESGDVYYEYLDYNPEIPREAMCYYIEMKGTVIPDICYYWAKSGSGYTYLDTAGRVRDAEFLAKYGHTTWDISPTVTYPAGGGITFGGDTTEMDSDVVQKRN